jgi:hypothetical protein
MLNAGLMVMEDQFKQNPALEPNRDVLEGWLRQQMAGADALLAFYSTPTGQRLAGRQSELMQRGQVIGREVGQAHQAELEAAVRARNAKLDACGTTK